MGRPSHSCGERPHTSQCNTTSTNQTQTLPALDANAEQTHGAHKQICLALACLALALLRKQFAQIYSANQTGGPQFKALARRPNHLGESALMEEPSKGLQNPNQNPNSSSNQGGPNQLGSSGQFEAIELVVESKRAK